MNSRMAAWRTAALTVICEYCEAEPGKPCTDRRNGYQLRAQAAHLVRLVAVGFGLEPVLEFDTPTETDTEPDTGETDHDYYRR